ncbi:protein kinase [Chelativorans sp. AA-79]|uniref:serine/threonine protein kinase n=1 Tax=Chelativorans sp. AA-79 TaxID=3028735 RepID=UPI0023FA135C|nr:protein kinase [Chelativorans sp. AA-79]WEX08249.1 protein kinase [Chelativorans sp. AA-79]
MSVQDTDMSRIAARFGALWQALTHEGDRVRDREESRLLIDRVRAALDRGHAHFGAGSASDIVAGTFLVEELVHETPRAQIFRLRHRDLAEAYALKVLHPECADDPTLSDLLLREARIHTALHHTNIVIAHLPLRLADGRPALLLEWVGGGSLSQRLNGSRCFSPSDICGIMEALLSGLQAIHTAGFVHADITPANLLFAEDSPISLKIADFGISVERRSASGPDSAVRARSRLAPPQCLANGLPNERADLYACGQILLRLLDHCTRTADAALASFAERLICGDPTRCPGSAGEALAALRAIAG